MTLLRVAGASAVLSWRLAVRAGAPESTAQAPPGVLLDGIHDTLVLFCRSGRRGRGRLAGAFACVTSLASLLCVDGDAPPLQRETARVDHLSREIDDLEGAGAGKGLPLLAELDGKPDDERALGVSRGINQESKEPGTDLVVVSARPRALPRTSLGG